MIQMNTDRHLHLGRQLVRGCRECLDTGHMPLRSVAGKQLNQNRSLRLFRRPDNALDRVVVKAVDCEYRSIRLLRVSDDLDAFFYCHN